MTKTYSHIRPESDTLIVGSKLSVDGRPCTVKEIHGPDELTVLEEDGETMRLTLIRPKPYIHESPRRLQ